MASTKTAIEWTDKTWNPTVGCSKVSPGCKHCYAEAITKRFKNHFPQASSWTSVFETKGEWGPPYGGKAG